MEKLFSLYTTVLNIPTEEARNTALVSLMGENQEGWAEFQSYASKLGVKVPDNTTTPSTPGILSKVVATVTSVPHLVGEKVDDVKDYRFGKRSIKESIRLQGGQLRDAARAAREVLKNEEKESVPA